MCHFLKQMADRLPLSRSISIAVQNDYSQQNDVWPVNSYRHFINTGVICPADKTTIKEEDNQYAEDVEMEHDTIENPDLNGDKMEEEEGPEVDEMEEDPESKNIATDVSTRPDIFPEAYAELRI
jgi:hypothetical protein